MFKKILIANRGEIALAHPARLPRDGRQVGRRVLRGRPRRQVRQAGRRGGLHRPGAVGVELPQHAGHHLDRRGHRRRGDPPRLRLPERKRRLRRARRAQWLRLHRADAGVDPHHGRQGRGQAGHDQVGGALRAGFRGRAARGSEGDRQDRTHGRLSGDHQGRRRRRRARHARGAHRGRVAARGADDPCRGRRRLRQPGRVHGEVPREPAPRRNPGAGRRAQGRRLAGRARLLDAAAPPEDHRRGAGAWNRAAHDRTHRRPLRRGLPRRSATAAPAPSSSCTRTASSTSSR